MDLTCCDERVYTRSGCMPNRFPGSVDILRRSTGQATDDGNIAIVGNVVSHILGDLPNCFQRTRQQRSSLHGRVGRPSYLFAIPESCIEDTDVVGVTDLVGDVLRARRSATRRAYRDEAAPPPPVNECSCKPRACAGCSGTHHRGRAPMALRHTRGGHREACNRCILHSHHLSTQADAGCVACVAFAQTASLATLGQFVTGRKVRHHASYGEARSLVVSASVSVSRYRTFADGVHTSISSEVLRVMSPPAAARPSERRGRRRPSELLAAQLICLLREQGTGATPRGPELRRRGGARGEPAERTPARAVASGADTLPAPRSSTAAAERHYNQQRSLAGGRRSRSASASGAARERAGCWPDALPSLPPRRPPARPCACACACALLDRRTHTRRALAREPEDRLTHGGDKAEGATNSVPAPHPLPSLQRSGAVAGAFARRRLRLDVRVRGAEAGPLPFTSARSRMRPRPSCGTRPPERWRPSLCTPLPLIAGPGGPFQPVCGPNAANKRGKAWIAQSRVLPARLHRGCPAGLSRAPPPHADAPALSIPYRPPRRPGWRAAPHDWDPRPRGRRTPAANCT
eukprot:scaffold1017_cov374-Prasinococcus_capsulatus_cf.AAC.8